MYIKYIGKLQFYTSLLSLLVSSLFISQVLFTLWSRESKTVTLSGIGWICISWVVIINGLALCRCLTRRASQDKLCGGGDDDDVGYIYVMHFSSWST